MLDFDFDFEAISADAKNALAEMGANLQNYVLKNPAANVYARKAQIIALIRFYNSVLPKIESMVEDQKNAYARGFQAGQQQRQDGRNWITMEEKEIFRGNYNARKYEVWADHL